MSNRLSNLFQQQLQHKNATLEKQELLMLMADPDNEQKINDLLKGYWEAFDPDDDLNLPVFQPGQGEDMLNLILTEQVYPSKTPIRKVKIWPRISIAAAVSFLAIGIYFYSHLSVVTKDVKTATHVNDIAPGKKGATLTLANGQKIVINDILSGNIAKQSGVRISKTTDGQIIYELTDNNSSTTEYNTLSSARGQQAQVRLPDGSVVYLNAASSLKYPTSFAKLKERIVSLTGEGYFEVAKDKAHPFVVKTTNQEIEVLGTHFNINAYPEQATSKTTLVEGKVAISDRHNSFVLTPNDQAITTSGTTRVKQVNVDNYTAWRNGKFSFDDKTFQETMSEIGRWYDLDIAYENGIPKEELIGDAFRNQNISFVLRLLDVAEIDYKLDVSHRKLTIKGKKNRIEHLNK